ncbi:MAG: hypothetical protein Q4B68_06045 [Bacteroidales bacterium]|nr:hypothetical protein [Bacteroidales bacterium]
MIYLFEDRHDRRDNYALLINKYKPLITFKNFDDYIVDEKDSPIQNLNNSLQNLDSPELILLHASYRFINDSISMDDVICAIKSLYNIPVVIFSGGFVHPSIDKIQNKHQIFRVNSIVMYEHLEYYLSQISKGETPPVEVLLWGENYIQNVLTRLQSNLVRLLVHYTPNDVVDEDTIDLMRDSVEDILQDYVFQKQKEALLKIIVPQQKYDTLFYNIQFIMNK